LQEQLETSETAHHKEISQMSEQYNNKVQSLLEKIENIQETKTAEKVTE
jgi:hypothetical protein